MTGTALVGRKSARLAVDQVSDWCFVLDYCYDRIRKSESHRTENSLSAW